MPFSSSMTYSISFRSVLSLCAFEHRVWFLSDDVPPGWEPADNGCLYSVYSVCVWFSHWLFVAFCSTVRRGWQVFKLHISFNIERWCRAIRGQHEHKGTQTHTIPINLSDNLYWALLERKKRMRKSIGQRPPWNSCCCTVTRRFHMCTAPILDRGRWREIVGTTRKDKRDKTRPEVLDITKSQENVLCDESVGHSLHLWNMLFF